MPEIRRILIVEDDESVAAHFAEVLRAEGYEVHVAHDGEGAVTQARTLAQDGRSIEIVLLDLRLPGWNPALPLIPHLREHHRFAEIVIITGEKRWEVMYEAFREYRVFDFLEKPVELLPLRMAVEKAGNRSGERRQISRIHRERLERNRELACEIEAHVREVRRWRTEFLRSELARFEHEHRCDRLLEVGLELLSAADLDGLLETAVEAMYEMVPSEATVILLRKTFEDLDWFEGYPEDEFSRLYHRIHHPGSELDEGTLERVGRRLARDSISSGQIIRLPEGNAGMPPDLDLAVRSVLCVPLLDSARGVVGVIQLFNRLPERDRIGGPEFTDDDEKTIKTVAEFLARGIQRQREIGLDLLTRIPNRLVLRQRTDEAIERLGLPHREGEHETYFAVLDVDHFGRFNKEQGHSTGDLILRTVARTIAGALREHDFVARFGGDEFCLLLKRVEDEDAARAILERIRLAVSAIPVPRASEQSLQRVTVSIAGTRLVATDTFVRVFDRADRALKRLKGSDDGRNSVAIEPAPE